MASLTRDCNWSAALHDADGYYMPSSSSYAARYSYCLKTFNGIRPFSQANCGCVDGSNQPNDMTNAYSFNLEHFYDADLMAFNQYAWGDCGGIGIQSGIPTGRTNYSASVEQFRLYATRTDTWVGDTTATWVSSVGDNECPSAGGDSFSGDDDLLGGVYWNPDYISSWNAGSPYSSWSSGASIDPGTTASGFTVFYSIDNPNNAPKYTSALSGLIDYAPKHQAAYAAMMAQAFPADFTIPGWSMTFNDAPQVFQQVGYVEPVFYGHAAAAYLGGRMLDLSDSQWNPSIYSGSAVIGDEPTGGGYVMPRETSFNAAASSGWCVGRMFNVSLWRGQLKNTNATKPLIYYVMKYMGFGRLSGIPMANPRAPDMDSVGGFDPAGAIINVIGGPHFLSPSGLPGDTVECPQPQDNFWPNGGFMQASNAAIVEDFCFLIVGITPTAWAAANGYTITGGTPPPLSSDNSGSTSDGIGLTSD